MKTAKDILTLAEKYARNLKAENCLESWYSDSVRSKFFQDTKDSKEELESALLEVDEFNQQIKVVLLAILQDLRYGDARLSCYSSGGVESLLKEFPQETGSLVRKVKDSKTLRQASNQALMVMQACKAIGLPGTTAPAYEDAIKGLEESLNFSLIQDSN